MTIDVVNHKQFIKLYVVLIENEVLNGALLLGGVTIQEQFTFVKL